jgi:glycosyltransferase involved in cell wall biosynthesis
VVHDLTKVEQPGLRVLVLHNLYQQPGGEDTVARNEVAMLRAAGHEVFFETVSNETISRLRAKADAFLTAAYNPRSAQWAVDLARRTRAEVVHIHNFFPLLSPSVHEAVARSGVAVVQTLHNFRLTCVGGLLLRNGHICEKCVSGSRLWGLAHGCYRNSRLQSLPAVAMQLRAARHRTWDTSVHRFIALSEFQRGKFIEAGLPAERLMVKPNFFVGGDGGPAPSPSGRSGVLFVGRLSREKGVDVLIEAMRRLPDVTLNVLGDGPERASLQAMAPPNVTFGGRVGAKAVRQAMLTSACLVVPSRWYEAFPLTVVEAYAARVPLVVSRIGSLAEVVRDGVSGLHFTTGDAEDLAAKLRQLLALHDRGAAFAAAGHAAYRTLFSQEANLPQLEAIYRAAISDAG